MARKDFHHPFTPYDIQQQFMEAVYECLEEGKVGIFESPTGTGKSLSLICGSLTWLREHKRKKFDEEMAKVEVEGDGDEPDWMMEHARKARSREIRHMRADFEARLADVREQEKKIKERLANGEPIQKRQKRLQSLPDELNDESQFLLDDYQSDDGSAGPKRNNVRAENAKLMEKLGMLSHKDQDRSQVTRPEELKIFFCSRTHSQLSQFVGELKRVRLPPGLPPERDEHDTVADGVEELKHLTLGSRKNLCINSKVSRLPTQTAVNEKCIELQQPNTPADKKCPYLPKPEREDLVLGFRDYALAELRDIEDLAELGSRLQICPYYASRPAINPAEIVTLPYPLLLQKSAREALGISLKGHVVIIDEAHNLMGAVEGIYSAQITDVQLKRAKEGLIAYLQKFRTRLKGSNRVYVAQVVRVIDSLLNFTVGVRTGSSDGFTTSPSALLADKNVDIIDISKVAKYMNESQLARKVEGYITFAKDTDGTKSMGARSRDDSEPVDVPVLMHVQEFLLTLMNPSREGRFLWSKEGDDVLLRYLLLEPSEHFRSVVEDARAVILAGGTMSPMEEYKQQLFPYIPNVTTFSCGHLIPPSSLFVRTISTDDDGRMEFSFKSRSEVNSIRLGQALEKVSRVVKAGLVIFFPSYRYLESVLVDWQSVGIMEKLKSNKPVFLDKRGSPVDETFRAYSNAIDSNDKGAVIMSVIGGKLSEGINFSDDLGRCVVVIGLPYPNVEAPEWKAKMMYLEQKARMRGQPLGRASREYAENVCMRSVNQAIGRAIRHKNDWASIVLLDARYAEARVQAKLPGWIRTCSDPTQSGVVEEAVGDLEAFLLDKATTAA